MWRARREATSLPEVTLSEFDGVRYLHLGSPWVQGAMRIGKPQQVELVYRHRCVEAWSMAVPWSGFPLKALVDFARPASAAATTHGLDLNPTTAAMTNAAATMDSMSSAGTEPLIAANNT